MSILGWKGVKVVKKEVVQKFCTAFSWSTCEQSVTKKDKLQIVFNKKNQPSSLYWKPIDVNS